MRNTIAVAGNMIIDKIKLLRAFPARHELTGILSVEESLGGAACNVGMDLARLDPSLPVRVFGVAGADADGDKVLRAFGAFPNIDVSRVRRRGQSSFTDVLTEERGRARTFLTFGGSNADFRETDVEADALSDVKLFHIGYILLLDALDAPDDEYGTKMARLLHNVQAAGADADGDKVLRAFGAFPNIDVSRVRRRGQSSFTDVLTEERGRARTFLTFGGSNADFRETDVEADALSDVKLFHIGYILLLDALDAPDDEYGTKMARLLHNVQAAGALTSVDVVSEAGDRFQRLVPPALKYTDYLIVNEIEAGKTAGLALRAPGGEIDEESVWKALRAIRRMGVSRWIVVHAPEGAWGLDENDREVFVRSAKLPQGYIQGTVGAGDAFCAGALLGAYRGEALKDALWYGAVAAACSLGKPGATEGVRKMEEALNAFERV